MFVRRFISANLLLLLSSCFALVSSQTTPAPRKTVRSSATSAQQRQNAPQVVTIVHRLNGLKMFRLLLRSPEQVEAIASLDDAFNLTEDVHTNIIAGLALSDGQTIAAWLPDAEVEFGPSTFAPPAPRAPEPQELKAITGGIPPMPRLSGFPFRGGMVGSPDLTVIGADGRRFAAEYVGLDGATGLSILRVSSGNVAANSKDTEDKVGEGEGVHLFKPERAETAGTGLYVRMATTFGKVFSVNRAPSGGGIARFKVRAPRLTASNLGGVAVDEAGKTLGIVDAIEGFEATILPIGLIQRAAKRVLTQQTSVPRPWLGVRGEAVARLSVEDIKNKGWRQDRAASLVEKRLGILLTSIAPGSPAASAALKPGDVILKVNDAEVQNSDDFSWILDQAGPRSELTFTIARPNRLTEESINVELSGLLDPSQAFRLGPRPTMNPSLLTQGIEAVALRPVVAARLGATSGLLVVYVDPAGTAFKAGLQPGDVIESIDGKPISTSAVTVLPSSVRGATSSFGVVRQKQKLVITLNPTEKKN